MFINLLESDAAFLICYSASQRSCSLQAACIVGLSTCAASPDVGQGIEASTRESISVEEHRQQHHFM